jgi:HAD superfamily hydrolase (TIGR01457 family)
MTETSDLLSYDGYLFDLDGTVYLGERLLPGAKEVVETLERMGKRFGFLSNKPIETRGNYAAKLTRLGIPTADERVINSSLVMARYLAKEQPGASVYAIGEPPLIRDLEDAGLRHTEEPEEIEWVVAAFDRTFDYRKLNIAMQAIKLGARFVATNPDRTCPMEDGEIPDAAGMIAAVEAVTAKQCELIVGKPSPIMARTGLELIGVPAERALMIGDRLETDIVMGRDAGMATALVLTGVATREELEASDVRPDYVLESVGELLA